MFVTTLQDKIAATRALIADQLHFTCDAFDTLQLAGTDLERTIARHFYGADAYDELAAERTDVLADADANLAYLATLLAA